MKMLKGMLMVAAFCTLCGPAFAEETKIDAEAKLKYSFVAELEGNMPSSVYKGEITVEEMEKRLHAAGPNSLLYIKHNKEKVMAFDYLAKDKASCRQIIFAAPHDEMVEAYTTDKKSFSQFWNTLRPYTNQWNLVDGYQVVCDKSPAVQLENKNKLYRLWFKKVKPDNRARRVEGGYGGGYPWWPIGIGVVIGRHSHYDGPPAPPPKHPKPPKPPHK